VGTVILLACAAAFHPPLVAASTVMMLLPNPMRLMLGYLAGALLTSITLGIVIVQTLNANNSTVSTTKHTVSPATDIVLGVIFLILSRVLGSGRTKQLAERRRARKAEKEDKGPPRWQRALGKGSARITFVIGALLTLPGASYLAGLDRIHKLDYPAAGTVLVIIGFNIIMLALLEVPIVCFAVAPKWTPGAIERARAWASRRGLYYVIRGLALIGVLLIVKGVVELIAA
jgi:Sap, sulfolipid-1-addressing protein